MTVSLGIVGMPNAGKSTLFNALTHSNVPAENYPFCTVDPHNGTVVLADSRLDPLAAILKPEEIIPSHLTLVDIAGLIEGSHRGEGLGNQFLNHIRNVDLILHVIRLFENRGVPYYSERSGPLKEYEIIRTELLLKDLEILDRRSEKLQRLCKIGDKDAKKELELVSFLHGKIEGGELKKEDVDNMHLPPDLIILSLKPELVVLNTGESDIPETASKLTDYLKERNVPVVPFPAGWESEICEMEEGEAVEMRRELGLASDSVGSLVSAAQSELNLLTYYTTAHQKLQSWSISSGSTLHDAAGKIHRDIQEGFIRAEVIQAEELISLGSEAACREKGVIRVEGKETPVRDGDIIHFKFRAPG